MRVRKHIMVHPNPESAGLEPGTVVETYEWLEWSDDEFRAHHDNPGSAGMIEAAHAASGDVIVDTVDHRQG